MLFMTLKTLPPATSSLLKMAPSFTGAATQFNV
jgi:hypothetical protein